MSYIDKLPAVAEAIRSMGIRGGLHDVYIAHDDDCPALVWGGDCTCEPHFYAFGKRIKIPKNRDN